MSSRKKRLLRYMLLYVLCLAGSHYWQRIQPSPDKGQVPKQPYVVISGPDGKPIYLSYESFGLPGQSGPPVVLVGLHPHSLRTLAQELSKTNWVLLPHLPGFGQSSHQVVDFGARMQADYLARFLKANEQKRVHLLGVGQGGAVALQLSASRPQAVLSLAMVSSNVVPETDLLGNAFLNSGIYRIWYTIAQLAEMILPHFGTIGHSALGPNTARAYLDSDPKPWRAYLDAWQGPLLILHGKSEVLIPFSASWELHRIVPQSELVRLDSGYDLVPSNPAQVAERAALFYQQVQQGKAVTRAQAGPTRIAAAKKPFNGDRLPMPDPGVIFFLFAVLSLATLVSEDLTCVAAGIMAARGIMPFTWATLACFAGIFIGDILLFLAGRFLGRPALKRAPLKWFVKEDAVARSSDWFDHKGAWIIIASRFTPGTRLPTYVAAGLLGAGFWKFTLIFLAASAVWTPILVGFSVFLGHKFLHYIDLYEQYALLTTIGALTLFWLIFKVGVPAMTYKGRRLLVSKFRRLTQWEFWPRSWVYPPVVLYFLYLALRNRSLRAVLAANPAIPLSGLKGEPKDMILNGLAGAGEAVARWQLIEGEQPRALRKKQIMAFLAGQRKPYPVVLKPNTGERGTGVAVIHSEDDIDVYLEKHEEPILVQAFAPGQEYGVFYIRRPHEEKGFIFSINVKHLLSIKGDGVHDLETLILRDERAVCTAQVFLRDHAHELFRIPGKGEKVLLGEIGAHCRGALFLDGNHLRTPELERFFDETSKQFKGFYFGRYDVRVPTEDDFKAGRNIKILELNGLTSEAAHMYDPKHSLLYAYKTLFTQWRFAVEIGKYNKRHGAPVAAYSEILDILTD